MKYLFLSISILFTYFSTAQNIDYENAINVINSNYSKNLFPEKKSHIEVINEIPDTINIDIKQTFRLLQYVKKKNGIFDIKRTDQLFTFTLKDTKLSHNEMILLNACKNEKPFIIKYTGEELTFSPLPTKITPKISEDSKIIFNNRFQEGFNLNLLSRIKFFFEDTKKGGDNWLSYYNDTKEKKEIALSYLTIRNYVAYKKSNSKNRLQPYKSFIDRMKIISYNSSDSKKFKTIIKDILLIQREKNYVGYDFLIKSL